MVSEMASEKQATIPEGYKQTEVGVIPEDWGVTALSSKLKENPKYGINAAAVALTGNLPVYLRITDISEDGYFKPSTKVGVDNPFSSLYKLETGDLVVARTGASVGKSYLYRPEDGELIYAGFLIKLSPDQHKLKSDFLFQYLRSESYWAWVVVMSMRSGQPGINGVEYGQLSIPLPSPEEQTAIANALSDVDNLIAALETLITKKSAIKTAAMQQLLTGKTRLPGFGNQGDSHLTDSRSMADTTHIKDTDQTATRLGYKQTELGEIPEDWGVKALGDIGESIIGLTYSPNDVADFGSLVLRSSNVQKNRLAFENNVFVDMELPDRVIVRENDILVCVRNGSRQLIGKCALIDEKTAGSAFGAFMSIYRTEFSKFVFFQFQSNIIQNQINEVMGATINQITNKDMAGFKIPVPNDEQEQTAIATVLSDMDAELDALQQRLDKTQLIKQGMMQELLTGKTRLI